MEDLAMKDLTLYARACSKQNDCSTCPLGTAKEVNLSCTQFLVDHPDKAYPILKQMVGEPHTYYNEYCKRFPVANLSMQEVSTAFCRKAMFDGDFSCETGDEISCTRCWNEVFGGDFIVQESEELFDKDDDISYLR